MTACFFEVAGRAASGHPRDRETDPRPGARLSSQPQRSQGVGPPEPSGPHAPAPRPSLVARPELPGPGLTRSAARNVRLGAGGRRGGGRGPGDGGRRLQPGVAGARD